MKDRTNDAATRAVIDHLLRGQYPEAEAQLICGAAAEQYPGDEREWEVAIGERARVWLDTTFQSEDDPGDLEVYQLTGGDLDAVDWDRVGAALYQWHTGGGDR